MLKVTRSVSKGGKVRPRLCFGLLGGDRKHLGSSRVKYQSVAALHPIQKVLNANRFNAMLELIRHRDYGHWPNLGCQAPERRQVDAPAE
jgi:hypothetical protein